MGPVAEYMKNRLVWSEPPTDEDIQNAWLLISFSALMLAAYAGNLEIINLLLKRGANAHLEDNRGRKLMLHLSLSKLSSSSWLQLCILNTVKVDCKTRPMSIAVWQTCLNCALLIRDTKLVNQFNWFDNKRFVIE